MNEMSTDKTTVLPDPEFKWERIQMPSRPEDVLAIESLRYNVICTPLSEYIANLERDPVMKAHIDRARRELRAQKKWYRRLLRWVTK